MTAPTSQPRKFLYITPYFPPQTRVGALRPLKFVRHLPAMGWEPIVLMDLKRSDGVSLQVAAAVPSEIAVVPDYSCAAAANFRGFEEASLDDAPAPPPAKRSQSKWSRALASISAALPMPSPELLPLGEHSVDMPYALKASRRLIAAHPEIELILVNADPWAGLLVGAKLAAETGLPLVSDLRDPWSVCELRRPNRRAPQRVLVDRLERSVVERSARFVVNTETAGRDYRRKYADIPKERFEVIRNHSDPELIGAGEWPAPAVFTALFFGNFRRHVEGDVVFRVLAELQSRGVSPNDLRLMVTGTVPESSRLAADRAGVREYIDEHPYVPYREAGSFLRSADLLVSLSNTSSQRIPAKMFDYLTTPRPIVSISDSDELGEMLAGVAGVTHHGLSDTGAIADAFERAIDGGRHVSVDRDAAQFSSADAASRMAAIFESVTAKAAGSDSRGRP